MSERCPDPTEEMIAAILNDEVDRYDDGFLTDLCLLIRGQECFPAELRTKMLAELNASQRTYSELVRAFTSRPTPAGGPWRTDFKNVEPYTQYWLACEGEYTTGFYCSVGGYWCYGDPSLGEYHAIDLEVFAFAEINLPEIPK